MTQTSWSERFKLIVTVGLLLLDEDKILLLRRHGTGWLDGYYGLVGGCIDGNESVTDAIIREAHEEADILIKPEWLTMVGVTHSKFNKANSETMETVDFFFIGRQWEGTIHNNEPHKHDELKFFPLDQLPHPLMPHAKLGLDHILTGSYFGQYGWK